MRGPTIVVLLLLSSGLAACVAARPDEPAESADSAESELASSDVTPGKKIFDGDIALEEEDETTGASAGALTPSQFALPDKSSLWPDGKVPYTIDSSVSSVHRKHIAAAIDQWEAKTVVRFVQRKNESAYVTFTEPAGNGLCMANLGYVAGKHRFVYLRDVARKGACNLGVVTHEMGHSLGLVHEQQRPDRDKYVKIIPHCIPSGLSGAFAISPTRKKLREYDITSTMHYRSTTLMNGCYPITDKAGKALLHDWATLSDGDIAAMADLYGPVAPPPAPTTDAGVADASPAGSTPDAATPAADPDTDSDDAGSRRHSPLPSGSAVADGGCGVAPLTVPGPLPFGMSALALAAMLVRRARQRRRA